MRSSRLRQAGSAAAATAVVTGLMLWMTTPATAATDEEWTQYQAWLCSTFGYCDLGDDYPPPVAEQEQGAASLDGLDNGYAPSPPAVPNSTDTFQTETQVGQDGWVSAEPASPPVPDVPMPEAPAVPAVPPVPPVPDVPQAPAAGTAGSSTAAVQFAMAQVGKPYLWGATGPSAFDCSGLVQRSFGTVNVKLPRVASEQYKAGSHVPVAQAQAGDLLFWAVDPSRPATINHVAMYLGDGQIVEASQPGVPVRVRKVNFNEQQLVPTATRPAS